jgi:hypothetical protein
MAKIPYYFETPIPTYFRENGFFECEHMFKFVMWAFSRCQTIPHTERKFGREIHLAAYEFIAGRLSSPKECFLSENVFRNQINQLLKAGLLIKSTNSITNKYTCYVWVVERFTTQNTNSNNQQNNQQITNRQPTDNHKVRIRDNKKEREIQITPTPSLPIPSKIKFKEFVELAQTEYDSLLTKHGQEFLNRMLDILDAYKGSSGKKYASDYHTMKQGGWVYNRAKKDIQEQARAHEKPFYSVAKTPPGNTPGAEPTKFQPPRVLRVSNAVEGDQGILHG